MTARFQPHARYLQVHEVGSFVASFVPGRADFDRLDPRFRLPDSVWDRVPSADDFGFAVFQLQPGKHHVHPMAFRFRTRDPSRLFFPTVHVHDGRVHARAKFDHALYYQHPRVTSLPNMGGPRDTHEGDQVSFLLPSSDYDGVTSGSHPVLRRELRGRMPNRDTYISLASG